MVGEVGVASWTRDSGLTSNTAFHTVVHTVRAYLLIPPLVPVSLLLNYDLHVAFWARLLGRFKLPSVRQGKGFLTRVAVKNLLPASPSRPPTVSVLDR